MNMRGYVYEQIFYEFSILKVNDRGIRSALRVIDYDKENGFKIFNEAECSTKYTLIYIKKQNLLQ